MKMMTTAIVALFACAALANDPAHTTAAPAAAPAPAAKTKEAKGAATTTATTATATEDCATIKDAAAKKACEDKKAAHK